MAADAQLKKSPSTKECMTQADPSKEASTVKNTNGYSSSNEITHYFKWLQKVF